LRGYAIDGAQGPKNITVVNNIFINSGETTLKFSEDLGEHTIFNNVLFSSSGSMTMGSSNFDSDYNIVSSGATLYGSHSFTSTESALFVGGGDYHLRSGSPAIDAGIGSFNSISAPTTDLEGSSRPQGSGYDIGAYEY
jgi:hypothetical protein